jgi:hypothetical protein
LFQLSADALGSAVAFCSANKAGVQNSHAQRNKLIPNLTTCAHSRPTIGFYMTATLIPPSAQLANGDHVGLRGLPCTLFSSFARPQQQMKAASPHGDET